MKCFTSDCFAFLGTCIGVSAIGFALNASQAFAADYCFPLISDPNGPETCLNTEIPIRCKKGETDNESAIVLESGTWKFSLNGKRLTSATCTEERADGDVRVNCNYGSLFLNVNLKSGSLADTPNELSLFGTEGGLIFGIPYGQSVSCLGTVKN